jgi:hypothetical protein
MNYLIVSNTEHSFAVRTAAMEAAGVIQALIAKTILEVAPHSGSVCISPLKIQNQC